MNCRFVVSDLAQSFLGLANEASSFIVFQAGIVVRVLHRFPRGVIYPILKLGKF